MNILFNGGYGFIGSNFINYIYDKEPNINIVILDAMYYCANENILWQGNQNCFGKCIEN